jgi:streptogramin lyase
MKKFISIILFTLILIPLFSQEQREYPISDKAYGIAWDGTYLYYLDSDRRAIIRFLENGEQEVFNLGLANMKGISFDSKEGRLLVTAPKVILKLDPNTGGVVERITIPLTHVGGIAAVDGSYYLLDLETGKIRFMDKASGMLVGGFLTDRSSPRDIAYGKESVWVSDSSNGSVYRYNPNNGRITGSIQAPANEIRGILFTGAKLWVVDRSSKQIRSIPFVETDRFISSGETEISISYKLYYTLPDISLAKSEIAILQPPTNELQRIRNLEADIKGFRNSTMNRSRSLNKKLDFTQDRGNQVTTLNFQVRISNTTYYIDDRFLKRKEAIPDELDRFRITEKENLNISPEDSISVFNSCLADSSSIESTHKRLLDEGYPSQLAKGFRWNKNNSEIINTNFLNTYFPGFGWIPISERNKKVGKDNRTYFAYEDEITLFQSDNKNEITTPVYFRSSPNEEWRPLESRWEIKITKK